EGVSAVWACRQNSASLTRTEIQTVPVPAWDVTRPGHEQPGARIGRIERSNRCRERRSRNEPGVLLHRRPGCYKRPPEPGVPKKNPARWATLLKRSRLDCGIFRQIRGNRFQPTR